MNIYTLAADESGDISFSFSKGASRYFVVAAISTENPDQLRDFVSDLRAQLGLPTDYEFKFGKLTNASLRNRIILALARQEFEAWAVIADKTVLSDTFRIMSGIEVFLYFVSELIQLIPPTQRELGTLILD
ncbi:MAG TPA: DUF3800 domain-containing protein, partial [Anaerolineae bacterium]